MSGRAIVINLAYQWHKQTKADSTQSTNQRNAERQALPKQADHYAKLTQTTISRTASHHHDNFREGLVRPAKIQISLRTGHILDS